MITQILDLGMHPYADSFIPADQLIHGEPISPLVVNLNTDTGEIKLSGTTNARDRYNLYEYSYTSGNSHTSREHWRSYADTMHLTINNVSTILEIGSNDGFLSNELSVRFPDAVVVGVDASEHMVALARLKYPSCVFKNDLFTANTIKTSKIDLIVANNVVNHMNFPLQFFCDIQKTLSDEGTFVFELPYWLIAVQNNQIDQVYHEHVTYFTLKYANWLAGESGLKITDFELVNYHGGSIRIYMKKQSSTTEPLVDKINNQIQVEVNSRVFDPRRYDEITRRNLEIHYNLIQRIYEIKKCGGTIVAIGAAAKGNTFLNYHKLDNKVISYVTDASPEKIGKYTPLSRIPIVSDDILKSIDDCYVLILAWNISSALRSKLLDINPTLKFIEFTNDS